MIQKGGEKATPHPIGQKAVRAKAALENGDAGVDMEKVSKKRKDRLSSSYNCRNDLKRTRREMRPQRS